MSLHSPQPTSHCQVSTKKRRRPVNVSFFPFDKWAPLESLLEARGGESKQPVIKSTEDQLPLHFSYHQGLQTRRWRASFDRKKWYFFSPLSFFFLLCFSLWIIIENNNITPTYNVTWLETYSSHSLLKTHPLVFRVRNLNTQVAPWKQSTDRKSVV